MTDKALNGLIWSAFGATCLICIQTLVLMILARMITPKEYGVVGIASIVIGFASIVAQPGIDHAIIQHPYLNSTHQRVGFTINIFSGFIIATLIFSSSKETTFPFLFMTLIFPGAITWFGASSFFSSVVFCVTCCSIALGIFL